MGIAPQLPGSLTPLELPIFCITIKTKVIWIMKDTRHLLGQKRFSHWTRSDGSAVGTSQSNRSPIVEWMIVIIDERFFGICFDQFFVPFETATGSRVHEPASPHEHPTFYKCQRIITQLVGQTGNPIQHPEKFTIEPVHVRDP